MEQNYEIVRKEQLWGRSYVVTNDGKEHILPSVTTVLKVLTEPKWEPIKQNFGDERWQRILDNAAYRGTVMHSMLENFLIEYSQSRDEEKALYKAQETAADILESDPKKEPQVRIGRNLFWNFYHEGFWKDIKKVLHNEVFLWTLFKGGWAGACDFIFQNWEDEHIVIDFKSSSGMKEEEDIESYFCQIASYMFMYAERYGVMPARGEIWIANEQNEEIQKFIVHSSDLKPHLRKFLSLLKEFQEKNMSIEKQTV
jgi:hypothetical protein